MKENQSQMVSLVNEIEENEASKENPSFISDEDIESIKPTLKN